ncbi:MAG TPA: DUF2283 domain-containing protein [Candidatus Kapabacteria bacterium]|jgi:uncharacterized protein YuzE|nr:DUF2283 domain-containing protein [Candidatus Kapabacteria bacterium]
MKLRIDKQADALYLRLDDSEIIDSEEVKPGVIFDYDSENNVVGVEILEVSKRIKSHTLPQLNFEAI